MRAPGGLPLLPSDADCGREPAAADADHKTLTALVPDAGAGVEALLDGAAASLILASILAAAAAAAASAAGERDGRVAGAWPFRLEAHEEMAAPVTGRVWEMIDADCATANLNFAAAAAAVAGAVLLCGAEPVAVTVPSVAARPRGDTVTSPIAWTRDEAGGLAVVSAAGAASPGLISPISAGMLLASTGGCLVTGVTALSPAASGANRTTLRRLSAR